MKLHIFYTIILTTGILYADNPNTTSSKPQPPAQAKVDDDKDGQVVAENMGVMVQALATFSQNPHNPIVAGTCALQALGAFIKMLIQIFDEFAPTRNMHSEQEIEQWFASLPKKKQLQIMQLMITYLQKCNTH